MLPAGDSLRSRADLSYLWHGKDRANMIRVVKNLGIDDVCTCDPFPGIAHFRYRPGSDSSGGPLGMRECLDCHYLHFPLAYVYVCDECTEPFLLEQFPPPKKNVELLCFDCALER